MLSLALFHLHTFLLAVANVSVVSLKMENGGINLRFGPDDQRVHEQSGLNLAAASRNHHFLPDGVCSGITGLLRVCVCEHVCVYSD